MIAYGIKHGDASPASYDGVMLTGRYCPAGRHIISTHAGLLDCTFTAI
jgi:hypothetical protein